MRKRNLGIVLSYTNTFLNMIIGLFLSSFLLRTLGDTEYGVYQTVASFANYLVLLEFGTGTVMTRNLCVCRSNNETELQVKKNISTVWSITNMLALLILSVSAIFYFAFDTIYVNSLTSEQIASGKNIFILITIYLLASFYAQTLSGIMLAFEDYTYSSSMSIAKILLRSVLLVAILINVRHAIIIAIVDAVLGISLALFGYVYATKRFKIRIDFKHFDLAILRSSMPLCLAIFLQAIVNQANSNVGKFILGISIGPEDVSLYSVALYVYSMFSSVSAIPITLYAPQVTREVTQGICGKELTNRLIQPSRLIVLAGGTVIGGFVAVGRQFVDIVYGEKYSLAWILAIILMVPMFIHITMSLVVNVLDAMNKRLTRSLIMMISTGINIAMTIFLIKYLGILGAAISTGASVLIQVILLSIYYAKGIRINILHLLRKAYKGILIYQVIGAAVAYYVATLLWRVNISVVTDFVSSKFVSFVVGGIIYVVISFGCFVLFGRNETEKVMIDSIVNKIKRKSR